MGAKHQIPKPKAKGSASIPAPKEPAGSTNSEKVRLSFELFDKGAECPSVWDSEEIKQLFSTFAKATEKTWQQVIETGGKSYGGKVGLGFTTFKNDPFKRPPQLSEDILLSEMRVSEKARFFGARKHAVYYVIRLDRDHAVC